MSKRKGSPQEEKRGGAGWLTTFNDLVTLLMVFFVLLFTMSDVDVKKLKTFQTALQSGLGVLRKGNMVPVGLPEIGKIPSHGTEDELVQEDNPVPTKLPGECDIPNMPPGELCEKREGDSKSGDPAGLHAEDSPGDLIDPSISDLDSEEGIRAVQRGKEIVITVEDRVLFASGAAKIDSRAFPMMERISSVLRKVPMQIRVEGHTDSDPIRTERFPSNWELSTARAVNMLKHLANAGKISAERLSAAGYGESKPLFPNDTKANKAKNRRVEIVLIMEEES